MDDEIAALHQKRDRLLTQIRTVDLGRAGDAFQGKAKTDARNQERAHKRQIEHERKQRQARELLKKFVQVSQDSPALNDSSFILLLTG